TIKISPKNITPTITVFCYGGCLTDCEEAAYELFIENEIFVEIICPTIIQPLNISTIKNSVRQTKNLLIVEEGFNFASLGSEIAAALLEDKLQLNNLKRIGNNSVIPSSIKAELDLLPGKSTIKQEILKVYAQ
ncbi:MAG: hypothetical protein NTZ59_12410, partial [Bacteroidetes bacterium]|nr:hypothetical protein [Bacteroidota bacterium]